MRARSIGIAVAVLWIAACSETPTGVSRTDGAIFAASGNSGAIWTTLASCGTPEQDINHFNVGDAVYINGSGFDPGTYNWAITGKPGGASTDPGVDVASSTVTPDASGAFCFLAYVVKGDDAGEYQVKVGDKGDNYRVEGAAYLEVTKTAATAYVRTYHWTIDKSADQSSLTLANGESSTVNYSVLVDVSGYTDSDWQVTGTITVNSMGTETANVTGVTDELSDALGAATLTCEGITFPVSLAPGESFTCTYEKMLGANPGTGTNTATATIDNGPVTVFDSDPVPFDFAEATVTPVDASVTVNDDLYGALGTVLLADAPKTFNYSMDVGPFETCGPQTVTNTATFTTADNGLTDSDSWTVDVTVTCPGQCTLTQGYWKNHADWPAGYSPSDMFFGSGMTWQQILDTAPKQGNSYVILAHQYIAAVLNQASGASVPGEVQDALDAAANFFNNAGSNTYAKDNTLNGWASTLDDYNNGLIGPGHCTD